MTNVKVKDIADELNTKSKRIIEKLEEIKISGKGPMSKLTDDEVEKLYKYIGFIRPQKEEPAEAGCDEPVQAAAPKPVPQEKPSVAQHRGQYIIRRVENVIDTGSKDNFQKKDPKKRYIVSSDDSGLLQGYTTTKNRQRKPAVVKKEEKPAAEVKKEAVVPVEAVKPAPEPVVKVEPPVVETPKTEKPEAVKIDRDKHEKAHSFEQKPVGEIAVKPPDTAVSKEEARSVKPAAAAKKTTGRAEIKKARPSAPVQAKEEKADTETEVKLEKAQDKKPGKKIEMQKQAKKETASEVVKTKKAAKITEEIEGVDLKTTARLFSEEQVEKTGLADEKVLDFYSKASPEFRRRQKKGKTKKIVQREIQKPSIPSEIKIDMTVTVKEFAEMIKKTAGSVIQKLMTLGVMATANEVIDFDTATLIADEYGIRTLLRDVKTEEDILFDDEAVEEKNLKTRPPVVVVMGHVDHGKTSLLDAIKNTNVTDMEEGGITQHIGAYMVTAGGREITFLDTPGHEAFTSLRARGAQVTDIAIIVVAADDGVMPQTVEAINHAKSANVNIIIAINKIDKPDANVDKVKQSLTEYGLVPEEWGGEVVCVPVSAKTGENISELLEMVILSADMMDLKADPGSQAKGTVIDARLDRNKGAITTVIVQRGTLKLGDYVITGTTVGKIRAMNDYNGTAITAAGPSTPAEVIGLPEVPEAGELFYAIDDQKVARQLVEKRKIKSREMQYKKHEVSSLEDFFSVIKEGEVKDLNLIIKADVQGSAEALKQSLTRLGNQEVAVKIIHDAVGNVTETDVSLAQVTGSIIIGFNIRPPASVLETARKNNVDLRLYSIIYEAIEDVENALKGMLAPKYREEVTGRAEIRETFKVSGIGTVAGCYVTDGKIIRNSKIRLTRNGIVVYTGELASLKRFKDDVREVTSGYECGTSIERFNDIKTGDIIEAYQMVEEGKA